MLDAGEYCISNVSFIVRILYVCRDEIYVIYSGKTSNRPKTTPFSLKIASRPRDGGSQHITEVMKGIQQNLPLEQP